jgi:Fur family peroxide stress response transcriptional regulator
MGTNKMTTTTPRYNELKQGLRDAGLKLTPQRLAILDMLATTHSHPTASAVYQALQPRFPTMSQTTVYNTLQTLASLGLIHELGTAGDDAVHYDTDTEPHINVICSQCGKILDRAETDAVPSLDSIAAQSGFEVRGARLVYYGLCPTCRRQQSTARKTT